MNIEMQERRKYTRMWDRPQYRQYSPGEACAETAIAALGMKPGESVTDFGCGTGRACAVFQRHGLSAWAIDHAINCLDPGIGVVLEVACLWQLADSLVLTDYGFCADVMEHIPPEQVDGVLACIAKRIATSAFFKISTVPDSCGKLIGETLHMTVRPPEWWLETVGRVFIVTSSVQPAHGEIEIIARRRVEHESREGAWKMTG